MRALFVLVVRSSRGLGAVAGITAANWRLVAIAHWL
jgi:hypothetical protein